MCNSGQRKVDKMKTGVFWEKYFTMSQTTFIYTKYINMKKFGDIKYLNLPHSYLTGLLSTYYKNNVVHQISKNGDKF